MVGVVVATGSCDYSIHDTCCSRLTSVFCFGSCVDVGAGSIGEASS